MPGKRKLIIFTDLDGTLLDHETYSWAPATEAITTLRQLGIPLILASSKTASEILPLKRQLGLEECPAIVENGGGLVFDGETGSSSPPVYDQILLALRDLAPEFGSRFKGFSQMTPREVSDLTGLTENAAKLAKDRRYSEPGLWSGSAADYERFCSTMADLGIAVQRGGRFSTLSYGADKVDRMAEVCAIYSSGHDRPFTLALGDAPNDLKMLMAADLGIVVPNPANCGTAQQLLEMGENLVLASAPGPDGWNEAVLRVLEQQQGKINGGLSPER